MKKWRKQKKHKNTNEQNYLRKTFAHTDSIIVNEGFFVYMHWVIIFLIIGSLVYFFLKVYDKEKFHFLIEGLNQGFSVVEVQSLWDCAKVCEIPEPISLFISQQMLTKCITEIMAKLNDQDNIKLRGLVRKLYDFKTRIEKDSDKKRGLDSTMGLENGQKLRIIFPGLGVFSSEILNNGRDITISLPTIDNQITVSAKDWIAQTISVYLWRTGDARYVFDTIVGSDGLYLGKPCLNLKHTTNLIRTQKRNAIRVKCHIFADLYIILEEKIDFNKVETKPGFKCLLEDISEKGALIKIGGKAPKDTKLRLQFQIENRLVIMFGVVRTSEFDEATNQSKLHFECIHIEDSMRTLILSYVYNTMPQKEKEIAEALKYTDEDENEAEKKNAENNSENNNEADTSNKTDATSIAEANAEALNNTQNGQTTFNQESEMIEQSTSNVAVDSQESEDETDKNMQDFPDFETSD